MRDLKLLIFRNIGSTSIFSLYFLELVFDDFFLKVFNDLAGKKEDI